MRKILKYSFFLPFAIWMTFRVPLYFQDRSSLVVRNEVCACAKFPGDPFDPKLQINFGSYAGVCVDNCKHRTAQIVSSDKIANVMHDNSFWIAEIPKASIRKAYLTLETFAPLVNHTAIDFEMDPKHPILLTSHDGERTAKVTNIIFSPEGAPPTGSQYRMWQGFWGNYPLMVRVYTLDQLKKSSREKKHELARIPLMLKGESLTRLYDNSLSLAVNKSFKSIYQLLYNNCATSSLDLALRSVGESVNFRNLLEPLRGLSTTLPFGTIYSWKSWGLARFEGEKILFTPASAAN